MAEFTETVTKTVNCPYCSSKSVVKNGRREDIQRYQCKGCGKRFTTTGKVHGHRFTSDQIGAAIRQFYSGTSYKQIAEYLEEVHDLPEPSKRTIYQWVKEYTDTALTKMEEHQAQTSGQWVADEMQVTVGGEKYWNWNVMDKGTRYLLASHLSKERDARAATAVFKKALAAADGPPKSVTTDKLRSYIKPIKDMLPDATHIQSQGLRAEVNNNLSERVQGTFRQRTKTLRGLDNKESGQRYLDGWVLQYNLFRGHEALDDGTPAEAAKVKPPFAEWSDVVKLGTTPTIGTALKAETPSPKVVTAPKPGPQRVSPNGVAADRKPATPRAVATMPRVSLPKRCKAKAKASRPKRNGKKAHPYAKLRNAARQTRRPRYRPRKRAA